MPKPVLVLDGSRFDDYEGFAREFSTLLDHTWNGRSLDAFNDVLRGGFGTPEEGFVLRWVDSDRSREALGWTATIKHLTEMLDRCHPENRDHIAAGLRDARRGEGATLFDTIVEIIRDHGLRGKEPEDGVVLELR